MCPIHYFCKARYHPTDTVPIPHTSTTTNAMSSHQIPYTYHSSYAGGDDSFVSNSRHRQPISLQPLELPDNSNHHHNRTDFAQDSSYSHHTQRSDLHTHSPSFTSSAYSIASPIRFPSLNTPAFEYPLSASVTSASASEKSPSSTSNFHYPQSLSESSIAATSASGVQSMSGGANPSASPVAHTSPTEQQSSASPTTTRLPVAEASGSVTGDSGSAAGGSGSTPGTGGRTNRQPRKEISNVVIACRQW